MATSDQVILVLINDVDLENYFVKWVIEAFNFAGGIISLTDLIPTGSTVNHTKVKQGSSYGDVDVMVVPKSIVLDESQFIYNTDIPCYLNIPLPKYDEYLRSFPTREGHFLSVEALKGLDIRMFRMVGIFTRVLSVLGFLTESKVGHVARVESKMSYTGERGKFSFFELMADLFAHTMHLIRSRMTKEGALTDVCSNRMMALKLDDHLSNDEVIYSRHSNECLTGATDGITDNVNHSYTDWREPTCVNASCSDGYDKTHESMMNSGLYNHEESEAPMETDSEPLQCSPEEFHVDIVPHFKLGSPPRKMMILGSEGNWPPPEAIEAINNGNFYVVARVCPANPNPDMDFCLSFGDAEKVLGEAMSTNQRNCLKVLKLMKPYLTNGVETLTTYHLKTALFLVSEMKDKCIWEERPIEENVKRVLEFLGMCLQIQFLPHFFIREANIIYGISEDDVLSVSERIESVMSGGVSLESCITTSPGARACKPSKEKVTRDSLLEILMEMTEDVMDGLIQFSNDGSRPQKIDVCRAATLLRESNSILSSIFLPSDLSKQMEIKDDNILKNIERFKSSNPRSSNDFGDQVIGVCNSMMDKGLECLINDSYSEFPDAFLSGGSQLLGIFAEKLADNDEPCSDEEERIGCFAEKLCISLQNEVEWMKSRLGKPMDKNNSACYK